MSDDIETPEGWERRGPCFTRVHDGKFAVLQPHPHRDRFRARVYEAGAYEVSTESALPLPEAVAWANAELGVTKPVEVHEREFADGSVLVWREDGKASARVSPFCGKQWFVDHADRDYLETKEQALTAAYEYVRGVQ